MKHHTTNWKPFIIWGILLVAVALVFLLKLNYIWLFLIAMLACHLGHKSITKGGHH